MCIGTLSFLVLKYLAWTYSTQVICVCGGGGGGGGETKQILEEEFQSFFKLQLFCVLPGSKHVWSLFWS